MVVFRDYRRSESDDWKLHVENYIGPFEGSLELLNSDGEVVGWIIKPIYE